MLTLHAQILNVILIVMVFLSLHSQAATLSTAINKYRSGNYTGCYNDLQDVVKDMSKNKDAQDLDKKILSISAKYDLQKIKNNDMDEIGKWYSESARHHHNHNPYAPSRMRYCYRSYP